MASPIPSPLPAWRRSWRASRFHAAAIDTRPPALTPVDFEGAGNATKRYHRKLVLVRTDEHVAWRGDALPDDVAGLVDTLRGAAS
jgi:hypothetical protein